MRLEKPKAYVPPALRNRTGTAAHSSAVSGGFQRDLKKPTHFTFDKPDGQKSGGGGKGPVGGIAVENQGECVILLICSRSSSSNRLFYWVEKMAKEKEMLEELQRLQV